MTDTLNMYHDAIAAYYAGNPIMSDEAFDALEQQLIANGYIIHKIRFEESNKQEVKHLTPALSLAAIHTKSQFTTMLYDAVCNIVGYEMLLMHKYDGMGCEAHYNTDGRLLKVVTRGDGYTGYDVTRKFVAAGKVPMQLAAAEQPYQIRFEAVIAKDIFAQKYHFNSDGSVKYKNERNTAAAFVKSLDMCGMEDIDPMAYMLTDILDDKIYEQTNPADALAKVGWPAEFIAEVFEVTDYNEFAETCTKIANERSEFKYRIDGIVVKPFADDMWIEQQFANAAEYANMVALKLDAMSAVTRVTRIDWRQRINGELFPRVELEPVELDGTTVKAASAFHYGFLYANGIWPGAIVRIEKGGDIIPDIQECIEPGDISKADIPVHAYVDGIHLMMPEEFARCTRFIKGVCKLNIDGLGWVYATKICEALLIAQDNLDVMLTFPDAPMIEDLFCIVQEVDNERLFELLQFDTNSKNDCTVITGLRERFNSIHLSHFIECMQIPGLGSKAAYQLSAYFSNCQYDFKGLSMEPIDKLIKLGTIQSLLVQYPLHFVMFNEMHENTSANTNTIKVVMTGSPKPTWATKGAFIDAANGKLEDVGANIDACDCVVTNDVNKLSNKMKAALAKGKKIVTYEELFKSL